MAQLTLTPLPYGTVNPFVTTPQVTLSDLYDEGDELFGASRTTGGVSRGKATGNVFNLADGG
jgi:hypothetical protein